MLCIAKTASCFPFSPAAVQLHKLVAAGEIPRYGRVLCTGVVHYFPGKKLFPCSIRLRSNLKSPEERPVAP